MLCIREVAKRLGVSYCKAHQLIRSLRVIGHYELNGTIRVSEEQLTDYLERTRRDGPDHTAMPPRRKPGQIELRHLRLKSRQ
jgi:excisionase family DNA binding protein